jgi:hypothetical protein
MWAPHIAYIYICKNQSLSNVFYYSLITIYHLEYEIRCDIVEFWFCIEMKALHELYSVFASNT